MALAKLGWQAEAVVSYQKALDRNPPASDLFDRPGVTRITMQLQNAQYQRAEQQQLPAEICKAAGNAAFKDKDYALAVMHYHGALRAAVVIDHNGSMVIPDCRETYHSTAGAHRIRAFAAGLLSYMPLFWAAVEGNLSQCLLKLKFFEEAKRCAEASLALAEPGSSVHAKSTLRLEQADAELARKRLSMAKAMSSQLGAHSSAACVVPDLHEMIMQVKDAAQARPGRSRWENMLGFVEFFAELELANAIHPAVAADHEHMAQLEFAIKHRRTARVPAVVSSAELYAAQNNEAIALAQQGDLLAAALVFEQSGDAANAAEDGNEAANFYNSQSACLVDLQ